MADKNDGGPAFPRDGGLYDGPNTKEFVPPQSGMSLRDYFATHAGEDAWRQFHYQSDPISSVAWRWRYADAMLAERGK